MFPARAHLGHLPRVPLSNQPQDSNKIHTVMSPPEKCEEFFPFETQSSQQPGEQAELPVPGGGWGGSSQSKWLAQGLKAKPWWGRKLGFPWNSRLTHHLPQDLPRVNS